MVAIVNIGWTSLGVIIDPIDGQLLADSGVLGLGGTINGLTILGWTDQACQLTLHRRNATNDADITTQRISLTTDSNNFQSIPIGAITLSLGERLTLTLDTGFIGSIQCSIQG